LLGFCAIERTPNGVIAHEPSGKFDIDKLKAGAAAWPGLDGMDLVPDVTSGQSYSWDETRWVWGNGYGRQENAPFHVVAGILEWDALSWRDRLSVLGMATPLKHARRELLPGATKKAASPTSWPSRTSRRARGETL